ncbi:aldose reductase-related protein 2-like isoform X2 [Cylas formicarius]|uniref:aldose reductase-related protein 2-like isoform X2 n=1 Tax=Cylas formicarius TaxID=197179 RepID=UPI0029586F6E|nr:aldose reductase-related protein 2-like isoform X2 [Cylas formicarius]
MNCQSVTLNGRFKMPIVGFGSGGIITAELMEETLNTALEAGYRHIDTATAYENEHLIGPVLQKWFSSGKLNREDIFITTKLPNYKLQPEKVEEQLKASLARLQINYVDLYLIHFPVARMEASPYEPSPLLPTDHVAIWKKMEEQVEMGRAKAIGVSNFTQNQIEKLINNSTIKPACLQSEIHLYLQQEPLVRFCHSNGLAVTAYSPLGHPGIGDWFKQNGIEKEFLPDELNDPTVQLIAKKHNVTSAQILLKFQIQRNIVVVPYTSKPSRVKTNFDLFSFSLDAADIKALIDSDKGERARIFGFENLNGF